MLEIEHVRHALVGSLPHGLRTRVELGRELALTIASSSTTWAW